MAACAGSKVPRHYGDPAAEYQAARKGLAIRDRSHRARLLVLGRAPIAALQGVLTGRMPSAPRASREGLLRAPVEYSAVLTPKGKVIADLRAMWGPNPDEEGLFLDVPAAAIEPLLAHLKRFVPPRLATIEDVTADSGIVNGSRTRGSGYDRGDRLGFRVPRIPGRGFGRRGVSRGRGGGQGRRGHRAQRGREGRPTDNEDL